MIISKKRKINIPLFWKFSVAILLIVILFGSINLYFLRQSTYRIFESELNRHAGVTVRSLAQLSTEYLLYEDIISLNRLIENLKSTDSSIAYIIISDEHNNVIGHSFESQIPVNLLHSLPPVGESHETFTLIEDTASGRLIHDYSYPVMDGILGNIKIGFYEDLFFVKMREPIRFFLLMILFFLIIGISGAFIFAHVITSPINKIIRGTENIKVDQKNNILKLPEERISNPRLFYFPDELNKLTDTFNMMLDRLRVAMAELQQAQKHLIQTEKMSSIGTLAAGIAHEINNPIAGIKNCLRRLQNDSVDTAQYEKYIGLMEHAIKRIETVVGGLLDFSRRHSLDFKLVSIEEVIENVLLLSSYELEKSRISIKKEFEKGTRQCIASKNHLEQVVLNLIINSIDAINERRLKDPSLYGIIGIKMKFEEKHITLSISDNGTGIDEKFLDNLFDPFFSRKKIKQGTGLGLSVSFALIEQHKGTLEAANNPEGGMTFTIRLPYNQN